VSMLSSSTPRRTSSRHSIGSQRAWVNLLNFVEMMILNWLEYMVHLDESVAVLG
jgi:hypothetical protein